MKNRKLLRPALCLLLALLAGCGPSREGPMEPEAESRALLSSGDLRGADLRELDLTGLEEAAYRWDFDTRTQWPEKLPEGFDPARLLDLGKDPGLGLRALHGRGITGRGVGIAIIDQALPADHQEYGDRLRFYQEYHTAAQGPASAHGPAVASIALGKTVGVAPEALLYFLADDLGTGEGAAFSRDLSWYAEDVDRLTALNETLPEGERIRVISMSVGWMPGDPGAEALEAAIARARAGGVGGGPMGTPTAWRTASPGPFGRRAFTAGNTGGRTGPFSWFPWMAAPPPPRRAKRSTPISPGAA